MMWAARADDGYLVGGLTRDCLETLRGVPMLVESSDPRVRERLLPDTYDSAEDEQQWREHSTPELERLFMSRLQIVRKDLAAVRKLEAIDLWVLLLPDTHANAWLASLNAARLALFVLNDLDARHLERDGDSLCTDKQREAVWRIQFLAEIQCILMGEMESMDDLGDPEDGDDEEHGKGADIDHGPMHDGPIPPLS
jgi:glycosidase